MQTKMQVLSSSIDGLAWRCGPGWVGAPLGKNGSRRRVTPDDAKAGRYTVDTTLLTRSTIVSRACMFMEFGHRSKSNRLTIRCMD